MGAHKLFFFIVFGLVRGNILYDTYFDIVRNFGNNLGTSFLGFNKKESALFSRVLSVNRYATKCMSKYHNLEAFLPSSSQHLFVINLDSEHSSNLLIQANETNLFAFPYIWLAFYDARKSLAERLNTTFSGLLIMVDSNFNLGEVQANGSFHIRKIFKKHVHQISYDIQDFGMWKNSRRTFTASRRNLGITLNSTMVIIHNDSINHLTDGRDTHLDCVTKINYLMLMELIYIYNITIKMSITDTWGYKTNRSLGMIGKLIRHEAEIAGTAFFFTRDRIDYLDYLMAISPTRAKFVFRQPKLSYITNVYILPFDRKVWISTGVLVSLMVVIMYLIMKWESRNDFIKMQAKRDGNIMDSSLQDAALVTIGAFCQQDSPTLPYSISGRITTLFLFISLMFIYVSYSANILALLQTPSKSIIKTIEDLLNSRVSVAVNDNVYSRFYFATVDAPIKKALYNKKVAPPGKPANFISLEEGVKKIREGLFAFHMEVGAGYKLIGETFKEDEKCDLQELEFLQLIDPYMAARKNSSYTEMFKIGLLLLHENGIQTKLNDLIYPKKPKCTSKGATYISVGMVDCYPLLVLLAGGIVSSIFVLLIEIYVHYKLIARK